LLEGVTDAQAFFGAGALSAPPEARNFWRGATKMKRTLFLMAALMLLVAGMALAQSPTTSAPGPTLQREPGTANNNLPNPGQPQTNTQDPQRAAEQNRNADSTATTGTTDATGTTDTTGTMNDQTTPTTATTGTTDTTTGTTGTMNDQSTTGTTGSMDTDTTASGTAANGHKLPATGSDLPLVGLVGLLALGAAAGLRQIQ
jgi:cobalamin biosynthesis Mg chelatase CobN